MRTFHTIGTVTLKPDGSTLGKEAYKLSDRRGVVDVPPSPVKRTVLQTLVYRQYAGPQIVNLTLAPTPTTYGESFTHTISPHAHGDDR